MTTLKDLEDFITTMYGTLGDFAPLFERLRGMEWQPIETAPKDGSWFLGYIQYSDGERGREVMKRVNDKKFPWKTSQASFRADIVTHWKPLDTPPEEASC